MKEYEITIRMRVGAENDTEARKKVVGEMVWSADVEECREIRKIVWEKDSREISESRILWSNKEYEIKGNRPGLPVFHWKKMWKWEWNRMKENMLEKIGMIPPMIQEVRIVEGESTVWVRMMEIGNSWKEFKKKKVGVEVE